MRDTKTSDEMHTECSLYRETGAEEVWIVNEEGLVRFFGKEKRERSEVTPTFSNPL